EMRSFPEFDTNLRPVARLLALEATLRAQDGDLEGALACCQAILNTFASAAEEPSLDAWVYAWASGYEALWQLERILAQGEPPPEALVAVQALLQGQEARPSFLTALSGERARYAAFAEQTGRPDIYGTELTVAGRLRMAARGQLRASVREGSLLLPASL